MLRLVAPERVADEALAVLLEVGVEGQPVDRLHLFRTGEPVQRLNLLAQVEKQLGLRVRPVHKGIQDAVLFADEQPIAPRRARHEQGVF